MMTESVREAKTIEDAIASALAELNTDENNIEIEVLQEPGKGLFGKTRPAKVKVKIKANHESEINHPANDIAAQEGKKVLKKILELMDIQDVEIKTQEEEDGLILMDINTEVGGLIIGKHGQTLSSLQYLINRICKLRENDNGKYILDVDGYRIRHQKTLEKMAESSAKKVITSQEKVVLQEMNAFDRRIIHLYFKNNAEVMTYSQGEGNFKKVVISPQNQGTSV